MTDYNDGKWHGWNGGVCPVHRESKVEIVTPEGGLESGVADDFFWGKDGDLDDIVAFRVTKPYREPKAIWVNEWTGAYFAYGSEDEARREAGSQAVRIAVKYVEAPE